MNRDGSVIARNIVPRVSATGPRRAIARRVVVLGLSMMSIASMAIASGCEVVDRDASTGKPDSTAVPGVVPESARGSVVTGGLATDSLATDSAAGAMAMRTDSLTAAADSGVVELYPTEPERGGVLFALAPDVATPSPRCTWASAPIPCYHSDNGVLVTVPLPADKEAGTFTLTIDRPSGRIVRQVTVADHEFGREMIFLTDSLYRRATSTREIARDARAIRGILSVESPDRRWNGRWREPLSGAKSAGYGVERYYYRASDSTRSISLDTQARTRGTFAADTSEAALSGAPSWRHAGIDIPARKGASVVAPAAGTVVDVGEYILSGRTVLIDHGQGVVSAYFHLDTALVSKGDQVRAGQRIARVGATGLATGPHLHYGVYLHGKDIDPAAWRQMPAWLVNDGKGTERRR